MSFGHHAKIKQGRASSGHALKKPVLSGSSGDLILRLPFFIFVAP
jgi:hypothetical protein